MFKPGQRNIKNQEVGGKCGYGSLVLIFKPCRITKRRSKKEDRGKTQTPTWGQKHPVNEVAGRLARLLQEGGRGKNEKLGEAYRCPGGRRFVMGESRFRPGGGLRSGVRKKKIAEKKTPGGAFTDAQPGYERGEGVQGSSLGKGAKKKCSMGGPGGAKGGGKGRLKLLPRDGWGGGQVLFY